ncbi:hypothetical protein [Streptomyces beihaiensis]|uniref:Uncharacterized protein n=1 Tax=Streptomyces beihaiensis TaxID=2984495 RepID=A0ABT3TSZ1_9ACTN|nr:hypothetical protein [Streptomyces beihaiensis]MCX3059532.1 hypothetical protein [Streptomyces beihaiensis]
MEHYEVSTRCAEAALLPAVRDADPRTPALADGFSCRTQIQYALLHALPDRTPVHLAEVPAEALRAGLSRS